MPSDLQCLSVPGRSLEAKDVLKFRCRLESQIGSDAQRDFTGAYLPRWRTIHLDEVRRVNGQVKLFPVFENDVFYKADGDYFYSDDFVDGAVLQLGPSKHSRDRAAKSFVVTEVDEKALLTKTQSLTQFFRDRSVPEDVIELLLAVRAAFVQRAGGELGMGIKGAGRRFRSVDDSGDRMVDPAEFAKALAEVDCDLPPGDVGRVFAAFDRNQDGHVSFDEFLAVLRGPMNNRRKKAVQKAFRKVDADGDGSITAHDIQVKYEARRHPDVVAGKSTEQDVIRAFLRRWDTRDRNGVVTFAEFCDYYNGVSASIDDDELFEAMLAAAWKV